MLDLPHNKYASQDSRPIDDDNLIEMDHVALQAARDILGIKRSQHYFDTVFGRPMQKQWALISSEERKSINTFINKIDPRVVKSKNMRVWMMNECQKLTHDGRIMPQDKKYLTQYGSSFKLMEKEKQIKAKNKMLEELNLKPELFVFATPTKSTLH